MHTVVDRYLSTDTMRRVDIFQRDNGTFGFEVAHWVEEDRCWCPFGRYSVAVIDTAERAAEEAHGRVDWLRGQDARQAQVITQWLEYMFDELCVSIGFCLRPFERKALSAILPRDPDQMTKAIFRAEDLDPVTANRATYSEVRAVVERSYSRHLAQ